MQILLIVIIGVVFIIHTFFYRERNTSDARAVILRQHDENTTKSRVASRNETTHNTRNDARRDDHSRRTDDGHSRRTDDGKRDEHLRRTEAREDGRREDERVRSREGSGTTLYKRGELISSARSHGPTT